MKEMSLADLSFSLRAKVLLIVDRIGLYKPFFHDPCFEAMNGSCAWYLINKYSLRANKLLFGRLYKIPYFIFVEEPSFPHPLHVTTFGSFKTSTKEFGREQKSKIDIE